LAFALPPLPLLTVLLLSVTLVLGATLMSPLEQAANSRLLARTVTRFLTFILFPLNRNRWDPFPMET
jgi:hypothetical protein